MKIAGKSEELYQKLWEYITKSRIPVLGTCAGAILLSQKKLISADIERNAFGRQINSFESELRIEPIGVEDSNAQAPSSQKANPSPIPDDVTTPDSEVVVPIQTASDKKEEETPTPAAAEPASQPAQKDRGCTDCHGGQETCGEKASGKNKEISFTGKPHT